MKIAPALQAPLIELLYRQSFAVLFANFVIPLPVIYVLHTHFSALALFAWVTAIYIVTIARVVLSWCFFHRRTGQHNGPSSLERWTYSFAALSWLSAALWGCLGWFGYLSTEPHLLAFTCIVLTGLVCGANPSLSAYPPAYIGTLTAMLLPMAIRTATDADPISRTYLAFIICLAGVNLYYSRTAFNAFIETIQLRFENSVLISRLEKERDKALAANRSKSRFLAAASHDLRQPIHALGLFIATLGAWSRRSDVDSEAAHTLSQRMQTVVINLSGLLDSLLDISRLDARVVKPVIGPVALSRFFNDLHEEFSGIAREKGIRFGIVQTSAWVETDPILLKRILGNLLSNALKFTNCGGVILGCRHRCGRVIVQIADTGTGIPKDQLTSVFDEFYQLDNEARDREKGLGLGLSIVKRTADLLKHDIKIRSIPNRGTIVSIALPLSAAIMPVHSHVSTPVTSGLSIVLLDDDRAVIEAMTQLLSSWGHRVIAGRNLDDLFNKIPTANSSNEAEVDFIIADYRLGSSLEGPEAIDRIRRRLNRNVPALLVTGDTSPEQLLDASRTGFRVLYKPVHPDELKDSLYS